MGVDQNRTVPLVSSHSGQVIAMKCEGARYVWRRKDWTCPVGSEGHGLEEAATGRGTLTSRGRDNATRTLLRKAPDLA